MPPENFDRLTDAEIQRKLMEIGFQNTPVTETTRPILIKKLKKHFQNEKLKKEKITNYVLYSKDKKSDVSPTVSTQRNLNLVENNLDNYIDNAHCRNTSMFSKSTANTGQISASRMYAPPPVLASNYGNENEPHTTYRKPRLIPCSLDAPAPYAKINGKVNNCDGGVVNRLLSFRDTSIQKNLKLNSKEVYSAAGAKASARTEIFKKLVTYDLRSFFKKPDISQYIIPHILIASLLIFLAVISVLYTAKKFELNSISQTDLTYTICHQSDNDLQVSSQKIMCISEDLFNKAMYISEELLKYLNERARLHHCIDKDYSPTLKMSELKVALSSDTNIQKDNMQNKLLATQYLIAENPQWMIKTIIPTINATEQGLSFELIEPNLPLKCIILKKITRFFTVVGILMLIALFCLIVYFVVVVYRIKQKEAVLQAEELKNDIINELMYQSSQTENSEVIITQLQHKLLPANKRSKLLKPWNKALKYLEENDSRILFGVIVRNEEQIRTMTWNKNSGNKELVTTKKWQSSAFDNSNKIVNPPTSCLKIRHMFDQTEIKQPNLKQLIVDSVFEKVGSNCKICDVQLDTLSCCVYIRCATEADAGIVHNEINGWWFDKRLISIKFLRLERFLSRFPKSLSDPLHYKFPNVN